MKPDIMAGHTVSADASPGTPAAWLASRFESARGQGSGNIPSMEGLRGFAVTLVFFVHYISQVEPWLASAPNVVRLARSLQVVGNSGVDLFFVLSGYLIYGTVLSREQPFLAFMRRRVRRIYPAFLAVFTLYLVLSLAVPSESKLPAGAGPALGFIVQNLLLLPGIFPLEPLITVAWSLSYEMFYYLVTPLAVAGLGMRRLSASRRLAIVALPAAAYVLLSLAGVLNGLLVRLIMFIAGILLFEALNDLRWRPLGPGATLAILVGGLAGTLIRIHGVVGSLLYIAFAFPAYFALCLACFGAPASWLPRAFSWTPLRWLGNMSYSYYLIHGLTLKAAFKVVAVILPATAGGAWVFWALLAPAFGLTLLTSAALFLAVEQPLSLAPSAARAARRSAAAQAV